MGRDRGHARVHLEVSRGRVGAVMNHSSYLAAILHHVDSLNRELREQDSPTQATFDPYAGLVEIHTYDSHGSWELVGKKKPVPNPSPGEDGDVLLWVDIPQHTTG